MELRVKILSMRSHRSSISLRKSSRQVIGSKVDGIGIRVLGKRYQGCVTGDGRIKQLQLIRLKVIIMSKKRIFYVNCKYVLMFMKVVLLV